MCIILYKPRGQSILIDLIASSIDYNPDGYGFMGIAADGRTTVRKGLDASAAELHRLASQFEQGECVLHLRRQTRGGAGLDNTHPFRVADDLYLMHNGTLPVDIRVAGRSDTWHFVHDYLSPLIERRRGLLYDPALRRIVESWIGPANKLVFLDAREGRIEIYNESQGCNHEGLWLSNSRWIDCRGLGLPLPAETRDLVRRGTEVRFF